MTNLNYTNTTTTTSGDKLKQKLSDWIHNLESGDNDYFAITAFENKMFYVCGRDATEIVSCNIIIDKGNGLESVCEYSNSNTNSSIPPFTLIVKKDKRLIMSSNDNIIGFGVKDIASSIQTLFVHVKTINVHTFIAASNSSRQIEVFKAISMDSNSDDPTLLERHTYVCSSSAQKGGGIICLLKLILML